VRLAPIIIVCLILTAVYAGTKRLSGLQSLIVLAVTALGILLVVFPNVSTRIANIFGVGRGADLVLYVALVGGLFVASNFYFRFKRHESVLIALARQSAIDHAHDPGTTSPARSAPDGKRTVEQIEKDSH